MNTYEMPFSHRLIMDDGGPGVALMDGSVISWAQWRAMRVSAAEYHRLIAEKRRVQNQCEEWDPDTGSWISRASEGSWTKAI
jgi:hypothetical protein